MTQIVTQEFKLGGKTLKLEYGRFAEQANAAILATYGETTVHVTAVMSSRDTDLDYFPLQVEFAEKLYAGGKIKGSRWVKREGKPTEDAILKARLIDRSIRPLFPKNVKKEVQVVATVLSVDGENDPDIPAMIATSAALHISDIPWDGPLAAVRVGLVKGEFVINPENSLRDASDLDLVVSGSKDAIVMVEAGANEVSEKQAVEALKLAHQEMQVAIEAIEELRRKVGKEKKVFPQPESLDSKLVQEISREVEAFLKPHLGVPGNKKGIADPVIEALAEKYADQLTKKQIAEIAHDVFKQMARRQTINQGIRLDGRKLDEIRPLETAVGLIPRVHGSAMFKRGATQALSIVTLGSPDMGQLIEYMDGEETKRYIHHYFMPPYSVGETGRIGWPSRREIGHGALGERALLPVIPSEEEFPYTIRVVSELMSSNGSTSQAAICGSTMALMHAGVPIKKPVAGIAMGLMTDGDKTVVLSDIRGEEDHIGDMDFKVAGTKDGITALQMDIKIAGISFEILETALEQARQGRLFIMAKMLEAIPEPNRHLSTYAPKIEQFEVPTDKIGEIIGPGGKMIKQIIADTGAEISVDDSTGKGLVTVSGVDQTAIDKAVAWIKGLIKTPEAGEEYQGTVKRIENYGAFVEFLPGKSGLVHVSKMGKGYIKDPRQVVELGQQVKVRVIKVDDHGRVDLALV